MEPKDKLNKRTERRKRALERIKKLLDNKKHLPKRFRDENGDITITGQDFSKARASYEQELKQQIKTLEERI